LSAVFIQIYDDDDDDCLSCYNYQYVFFHLSAVLITTKLYCKFVHMITVSTDNMLMSCVCHFVPVTELLSLLTNLAILI